MDNFLDRLKHVIDNHCKSVREFEQQVQVPNATFSKMLKHGSDTSIENLLKIFKRYPDIDANWLLKGEGKMKIEATPKAIYDDAIEDLKKAAIALAELVKGK